MESINKSIDNSFGQKNLQIDCSMSTIMYSINFNEGKALGCLFSPDNKNVYNLMFLYNDLNDFKKLNKSFNAENFSLLEELLKKEKSFQYFPIKDLTINNNVDDKNNYNFNNKNNLLINNVLINYMQNIFNLTYDGNSHQKKKNLTTNLISDNKKTLENLIKIPITNEYSIQKLKSSNNLMYDENNTKNNKILKNNLYQTFKQNNLAYNNLENRLMSNDPKNLQSNKNVYKLPKADYKNSIKLQKTPKPINNLLKNQTYKSDKLKVMPYKDNNLSYKKNLENKLVANYKKNKTPYRALNQAKKDNIYALPKIESKNKFVKEKIKSDDLIKEYNGKSNYNNTTKQNIKNSVYSIPKAYDSEKLKVRPYKKDTKSQTSYNTQSIVDKLKNNYNSIKKDKMPKAYSSVDKIISNDKKQKENYFKNLIPKPKSSSNYKNPIIVKKNNYTKPQKALMPYNANSNLYNLKALPQGKPYQKALPPSLSSNVLNMPKANYALSTGYSIGGKK
ncbi:MAG: hypothetical protein ACLFPJ_04430 [Candidatus Woesearchaeota archaeon]